MCACNFLKLEKLMNSAYTDTGLKHCVIEPSHGKQKCIGTFC